MDLDEAEARLRRKVAASQTDPSLDERAIATVLAEYDRRGAALAERDAEIERLRHELEQADTFGRGEFRVTRWAYDQALRVMREAKAEVARLRGQRDAALALHFDAGRSQGYTDDGGYGWVGNACATCGAHGEYGVPWPCPTARVFDGEDGDA